MAWNHKSRIVAMGIKIQAVPGVFELPGPDDLIAVSTPTNGEDMISTEDPTATGTIFSAPRVYLGRTGNAGATFALRGPGGADVPAANAWVPGRILQAAGFAEIRNIAPIAGNTSALGTTTAMTLAAAASAINDFYKGHPIQHAALGAGLKATSMITGYDGASKQATIAETAAAALASGSPYTIPKHLTYLLGTMTGVAPPLLSVSVYRDKKRYDYKDVSISSLGIDIPVANEQNTAFPSIEFTGKGLPNEPATVDIASTPAVAEAILRVPIPPYRNGKFYLDRKKLGHQSARFGMNAEVAGASNANQAQGQDQYEIMSADRTVDLDLNQMAVTDFDIDARVNAQTSLPLFSLWGLGAGNQIGFLLPDLALDPLNNPGDRNGYVNVTGNAAFTGYDKSAALTFFGW